MSVRGRRVLAASVLMLLPWRLLLAVPESGGLYQGLAVGRVDGLLRGRPGRLGRLLVGGRIDLESAASTVVRRVPLLALRPTEHLRHQPY